MKEFKNAMRLYVQRKTELEVGIIPFVEPGSIEEDMAFNELFFIYNQINTLVCGTKKIVDN